MKYYTPTTAEEIQERIEYLDQLISSEIEWANHINVMPCQTKINNLYNEIAEWEAKLK
jgi:hypothetical protein